MHCTDSKYLDNREKRYMVDTVVVIKNGQLVFNYYKRLSHNIFNTKEIMTSPLMRYWSRATRHIDIKDCDFRKIQYVVLRAITVCPLETRIHYVVSHFRTLHHIFLHYYRLYIIRY